MNNFKQKVLDFVAGISEADPELASEFEAVRTSETYKNESAVLEEKIPADAGGGLEIASDSATNFGLETIVMRVGRPVLAIADGSAVLEMNDVESEIWKERLQTASPMLSKIIPCVGRIELSNHPSFEWVGTGWMIDKNLVITNRHVAEVFSRREGNGFVFRQGMDGGKVKSFIDFLEEIGSGAELEFKCTEVLYIEPEPGPDIAFLRVKASGNRSLPTPIKLAATAAGKKDVAVIGYPARDSRIPDQPLMDNIFGDVYNKKRLSPGQVTGIKDNQLLHDCSTLGGNSGSVVLDLNSGEALGLHFAGRFMETNFAVPSTVILSRLKKLGNGPIETPVIATPVQDDTSKDEVKKPVATVTPVNSNGNTITLDYMIPLHLTINIGDLVKSQAASIPAPSAASDKQVEEDEQFFTEARPEDYADRKGYAEDFLGSTTALKVPLPKLTQDTKKKDILTFKDGSKTESILRYEHFSVQMSKSRRQCFYSAVNIDGKTSVPMKRGPWMLDPRIPAEAQIMKECYGAPPKFSRGHMTRREDPIWGTGDAPARGNRDSMHVTNSVPQMQDMNGGIWLGLENYALQNARQDDMRISVFTGPVFKPGDPIKYGVKIPMSFWKVIAFIHDETGKLSATGYVLSQKDFVPENEFVFGAYKTAQRSIESIEKLTGISFGKLTAADPIKSDNELPGDELGDFDDIKFI